MDYKAQPGLGANPPGHPASMAQLRIVTHPLNQAHQTALTGRSASQTLVTTTGGGNAPGGAVPPGGVGGPRPPPPGAAAAAPQLARGQSQQYQIFSHCMDKMMEIVAASPAFERHVKAADVKQAARHAVISMFANPKHALPMLGFLQNQLMFTN